MSQSVRRWLSVFFCGMCMGAADIVPGISGGTVAFILGIYEELINGIRSLNSSTVKLLVTCRFRLFFQSIPWPFLSALLLGIACSFVFLAHFIHYLLGHEEFRIYLYATFFGLVFASVIYCIKQLRQWQPAYIVYFLIGALAAYFLTGTALGDNTSGLNNTAGIDLWFVLCGAIAISAMLLPGISGSYLLTILGAYGTVLGALADFVRGLKTGVFDSEAFFLLASLGIGIVIGALTFSRAISWLLKNYHDAAISTLIGFMVGAVKMIWPFWTYHYVLQPLHPEKGPQLQVLEPFIPEAMSMTVALALLCAVCGFAAVFIPHVCKDNLTFLSFKKT